MDVILSFVEGNDVFGVIPTVVMGKVYVMNAVLPDLLDTNQRSPQQWL